MTNSLVSVLVPIYNVEAYIEQCVRSLFEQTYDNVEYVFCDDCSPDASIQILETIIKEYLQRSGRIQIMHHAKNWESAVARNTLFTNRKKLFR